MVTRPDAPAGRGRHERRSPVAVLAAEAGIPVLTPGRPREPEFLAALAALEPDCCPVVAYGALVPRVALDVPKRGWVNLHFSLLPAWRGAAPVQAALLHGDEVTGASTFLLAEGLDTGPVYGVVTETVRPRDTAGDLLERLSAAGPRCSPRTLDGIEDGTVVAVPQPAEGISLAPKVTVEDAGIDWSAPALAGGPAGPGVHARTRGLDRVRRGPAQARPRAAGGRRARARAGGAAGRAAAGAGRDRDLAGGARAGAGAGQEADAGAGLGPRRPAARRRPPRRPRMRRASGPGCARPRADDASAVPAAPGHRRPARGPHGALSRPRHGPAAGTRLGCLREDADRRPGAPGCRRRAVECRVRARSGSRG